MIAPMCDNVQLRVVRRSKRHEVLWYLEKVFVGMRYYIRDFHNVQGIGI